MAPTVGLRSTLSEQHGILCNLYFLGNAHNEVSTATVSQTWNWTAQSSVHGPIKCAHSHKQGSPLTASTSSCSLVPTRSSHWSRPAHSTNCGLWYAPCLLKCGSSHAIGLRGIVYAALTPHCNGTVPGASDTFRASPFRVPDLPPIVRRSRLYVG